MILDLSLFDKIENSKIEIIKNSKNNKPFALYLPDSETFLDLLNFRILKGNDLSLPNSPLCGADSSSQSGIIAFATEKNTLGENFLIPRLFFYDQTIAIYLGF